MIHGCIGNPCLICHPQLGHPIYVPVYVPVYVPYPQPIFQPPPQPVPYPQPSIVWCGPHTTGTATTGFQST